jgi:glycosyltransferase involved in cell wall biosynthesis
VRARLAESTARGRVVWTGFAEPTETSARLQALDAIALPFVEGACYRHGSLMAAIEHGLPIVTTRPDPRELALAAHGLESLVDGENALLAEPGDAAGLAAAVERLLVDPGLRRLISSGSLRLAPQFGWERIARTSLAAYDELLAARR